MYYLWSHRKRQWWRPDAQGYTDHLQDAGRYTAQEANEKALDALPGQTVPVTVELYEHFANLSPKEVIKMLDSFRDL